FREGWRFFAGSAVDERTNLLATIDTVTRCRRFSPGTGLRREAKLALGLFTSVHHPDVMSQGGCTMRCISLTMGTVIGAAGLVAAGPLYAQSANDWAMPANDFANTRYSTLNQINTGNVGKLQVAWTFSTGVLRGHEGAPLVIGDVMYVHTPF